MRKTGHMRQHIGCAAKALVCVMIAVTGLMQPSIAIAVEQIDQVSGDNEVNTDDLATVKYITAFAELAEEDVYLPCMYKPFLEELYGVFPETLAVQIEGEDEAVELDITWECEEDFDNTTLSLYYFYPKWDENRYAVADSVKDSIEIPCIVVEVPAESGMISDPEGARSSLQDILRTKSILALIYLCDKYEVKESASADSKVIDTVVCGQSVQITDVGLDEEGFVWYQVLFYQNGTAYTGYVEREFLATSDEDFTAWEENNLNFSAMPMMMASSIEYPDIEQFPASYQNALYALKEKHPNWVFVRMDTGLDWNTVIAKEMGDKSLIPAGSSGSWQNGIYGQGWSYASEGILKYYLDPRNFLTDPAIFQFEQLTYNSSYHTTNAVQEILKNSFMSSTIPGDSQTYAQAFTDIGQSLGISPFHLASRVLQEQGSRGTSMLISGTYADYEGYFNYFNVGASGKTNALVIQSGLKKAVEMGWNTRYKSLYGGASVIGANYILKGQDTLYLEKFNVSNGQHANFTHQYMQNIQAPSLEAFNIRMAYNNAGALENSFVFKIPVYNNMPASACSKPEVTDTITLDKTTISGLEVDKTATLIPYVNGSKVDYISNMTFSSSNTSVATVDEQGKVTAISPGTATISCTGSDAGSASCTVTVIKADPVVSTPVISPVTYRDGLKLSDIILPEGWLWSNGSTKIEVGTFSYSAVYTPADTTKYNAITKKINFTVTKSIPVCRVPENLEGKTGDTLGSIVLPTGFVWESSPETELTKAGEYTFYVSYNPNEDNYYTVSHIPVIVQVVESISSGNGSTGSTTSGNSTTGNTTDGNGTTGSTTSGSSTTGSTTGGNGSTGSTTSGSSTTGSTTGGNGSGGSTTSGSSTTGSTTDGNGTTGSSTSGSSTTGSTTGGNSSGGSTTSGSGTIGSTTDGNGSTGSTTSGSSTAGSTTGGNSSGGSTTSGSSTTGSTTDGGSSTGSTTGGNGSSGSTAGGSSSTGSASSGNSTTGSTAGGNSSTGNTTGGSSTTGGTTDGNNPAGIAADGSSAAGNTTDGNNLNGNSSGTDNANESASENSTDTLIVPQVTVIEGSQEDTNVYKPAVTIQMEDTSILTPEKLQMAKEQNFDILLDMGDYITWRIDIDSVNMEALTDVDMGVTLGTKNIPQELIAAILNGNKYIEFTLAHDGLFGFDPVLSIALNPENSGRYANLFYYNPELQTLEFICDSIIDANGVAAFKIEHASGYVIIVSDYSMSGMLIENEENKPVVRWIMIGVFIFMIVVVVGYAVFFCYRKRCETEDEDIEDEDFEDEDEDRDISKYGNEDEYEDDSEAEDEDADEDDWIEDKDWYEAETTKTKSIDGFADAHSEDDWFDDDGWDGEDDWMDDDEWEEKNKKF